MQQKELSFYLNYTKNILQTFLQKRNRRKVKNENQENNSLSESSNDVITQLEKLSKLKEDGVLTQEEFDIQKQQILNSKEKTTPAENKRDKKPTTVVIMAKKDGFIFDKTVFITNLY